MHSESPTERILEIRGLSKAYPGVQALRDVRLDLAGGEVLALLGENGAGKSTLIKILSGAVQPDAGEIFFQGRRLRCGSPTDARNAGIAVIHQEFNLVPSLSAADNLFLGQEQSRFGIVDRRAQHRRCRELFSRLGVAIRPGTPCSRLTVSQQQVVEIARALAFEAKVVVMDEPTAALTDREVDRLFAIVRELKAQGIGIVHVSHRLDEIFEVAGRVCVLRDGINVGDAAIGDIDRGKLIELMVGRTLDKEFPQRRAAIGAPRLRVRNLGRGISVRDVSFEIRRGEILALTGLVGSGRTETARLIFGADRPDLGTVELDGNLLDIRHPSDAIRHGITLLTEDRKTQGLILKQSVLANFGLPNLSRFARFGWVNSGSEREQFQRHADSLQIKFSNAGQAAGTLSGGNQQKVVLAKWLARNCEVLIFDEPTRGIDVGARYEIYQLIDELAASGKAVLMISSELPEVLGMADRILVMHEGRITGEIEDVRSATQQDIMSLAVA